MFPSSGLFIHINCPFWRCERPHCLYKHAGDQYDGSFTPVSENSLHELERLEKQIETAKHEVEQEQRRLSCYQTNQAERSGNTLGTKRDTGVSYGLCSTKDHNSHVQAKKYVVGNSKPRTDLEYDPLSNFTAALQSYSSSAKERKGKTQQDGRSSGGVRSGERPSTRQAQMYRPPSPEILEDSIEEGVLVIDVSLSPDKTSDQAQNTADLSGKSAQDAQRDAKEIKKGKHFLDSPPKMKTEAANAASSSASKENARKVPSDPTENDPVLSNFKKTKVNRNEDRSVANLTGCLEELRRRCENAGFKSPERVKKPTDSADFSTISEQPYHLSSPQPHPASQLKRPAPKQASITEQGEAQNVPSVIPEGEKVAVKTSTKAFMSQRRAEAGQSGCRAPNVTSVNPPGRTESSETTKRPLLQEDDEVIMISSSSEKEDDDDEEEEKEEKEENEINYSEIELSDSDPMEECYRIFMEANGKEGEEEEECSTSVMRLMSINQRNVNVSHSAVSIVFQPLPVRRKLKQQSEAGRDKVPHDVRQRYLNMFTQEFLKTTADVNEAFEKALAEEKNVYNRSTNKLKYLSVSVNVLKRLKSQSATAKSREKTLIMKSYVLSFSAADMVLYEIFKGYTLTDEQMIENNYPVQHPEKPGSAVLFSEKKASTDPLKRICCRCGATYSVDQTGKHLRKEECNYHYGKVKHQLVPGGVETRYSCCQGVMGAPGCQMFKVKNQVCGWLKNVHTFIDNISMCYTVQGLELSRVTVINSDLQVVYDTFVRPDNEVIDYNTRFSGISEDDVKGNHTSLWEVQDTLLSFISADTILVGHGLETDLCLLKLLHGVVVDTSVVFPHRLGPPNKLSLNSLTAEYLRRIIQESVCGHDTAEDAAACLELMLWKMKEDGKLKK
uniref:RNA exonuclease 1 homolog n=1 Tax=Fundulus heteroclitus TaxID=8078 RepID=A0A3Q2SSY6_FUNHE